MPGGESVCHRQCQTWGREDGGGRKEQALKISQSCDHLVITVSHTIPGFVVAKNYTETIVHVIHAATI
jgi:hypothetical protein